MSREADYPKSLGVEQGRRIDNLVNTSINARGDKARRASRDLAGLIEETGTLEPFVLGTHRYLSAMSRGRTPQEIANAGEALDRLVDNVVRIHRTSGPTSLGLDPATLRLVDAIDRTGQELTERPFHASKLPPSFDKLRSGFIGPVRNAAEAGVRRMDVSFAMKSEGINRKNTDFRLEEYNRWALELSAITNPETRIENMASFRDDLVDKLRTEPDSSFIGHGRGRTLDLEHGSGMSLSKIEALEDSTEPDNFRQIANYFTATNNSANINHKTILTDLLLEQTYFIATRGRESFRNEKMLANIARWQEQLVTYVALGAPDEEAEKAVQDLLKSFDQGQASAFILMAFTSWSVHPYELHPDTKETQQGWSGPSHPVLDRAVELYLQSHPDETSAFVHRDKVGRDYLISDGLPNLKAKVDQLGVGDKFAAGFESLVGVFEESSHEEQNLIGVIDSLDNNGGGEFVDRLKSQSTQIREVTSESWSSIFEGEGPRFLPMQGGVEVVEFSEGSLPDILGIDSLVVKRIGALPDWSVALSFKLKDTFLSVTGELDNSGEFSTNPRIMEAIPHFTDLLGYISVAAFRDLVTQREAAESKGKSRKSSARVVDTHDGDLVETQGGMLPRRQSSKSLVEDVYTITRTKPRRVDLHRMKLKGSDSYSEAITNYIAARDNGLSTDVVEMELAEARAKANNISEEKKRKVPAKYELLRVIDPVTGEEKYLQTWVIEHTVPKPTAEELANPTLLFRRYYKSSSNLAFLDQLKPWIVGE